MRVTDRRACGEKPGEISRRGEAIVERLPQEFVEAHLGETIVIDVDTGDFAVGRDPIAVLDDLKVRQPDPACYVARVGYVAWAHFGGAVPKRRP